MMPGLLLQVCADIDSEKDYAKINCLIMIGTKIIISNGNVREISALNISFNDVCDGIEAFHSIV